MKQIVLALTVAAAALGGLVAANASAEEPNACEAALFAKRPKLAGMKKIMLSEAKTLPKGVKVVDDGVSFDPDLWKLTDQGDGVIEVVSSAKKKKKKKKKKKGGTSSSPTQYATCLCGGSDRGGCMAFTNTSTGEVHCEDTGCSAGCRIGIFGDATELETLGYETL